MARSAKREGFTMALFDSLLRLLVPDSKNRKSGPGGKDKIERRAGARKSFAPSSVASDAITVMIADFDGPEGESFAERLVGPFGELPGLAILRRKESLRLSGSGGLLEKLTAAAERGRGWLQEAPADLLVWGEVSAETRSATLRLLPAMAEPDGLVGAFGLGDALEVPAAFGGDTERVVAATVLAAAVRGKAGAKGPAIDDLRRRLAEMPEPAALAPAEQMPATTASLLIGLGHAYAADVRCGGDPAGLNRTLACYRAAADRLTALTAPLLWAQAQNHLATSLSALAEAEQRPARMSEAVAVYRTMAETLTRIEHPNDWALAQARLGAALHRLGQMEGKPKHYRDAALAYEQALTVFTQAAHPVRWSDIMHHYGVLLTALGEHMSGTAALEQAVMVFRKALNVRRRDILPLFWAQTASGLGAAAFSLAKRNGDAASLREAVGCFEGALEIYGQLGQGPAIAVLQKNLQRAQRLLDTRGATLADDVAPKGAEAAARPAQPATAAAKRK
jgi:tetratricopeptide (TPR) repeat protein